MKQLLAFIFFTTIGFAAHGQDAGPRVILYYQVNEQNYGSKVTILESGLVTIEDDFYMQPHPVNKRVSQLSPQDLAHLKSLIDAAANGPQKVVPGSVDRGSVRGYLKVYTSKNEEVIIRMLTETGAYTGDLQINENEAAGEIQKLITDTDVNVKPDRLKPAAPTVAKCAGPNGLGGIKPSS